MHFPRHLPQHRSRPMRKKTGKSDPLNRARPTQKRPQQAPDPAFHTAPPPETPKNPPRNSKRPPRGAQKAPRRHQNPKKRRKGPGEQFTPTANPPRGRRCGVSLRISRGLQLVLARPISMHQVHTLQSEAFQRHDLQSKWEVAGLSDVYLVSITTNADRSLGEGEAATNKPTTLR